jgi:3-deoxy-manno-octulosonate cytidylyltransferase (CMP-KDO synthetase)
LKFQVIIPARYASTRFPGKPLADLRGKPMVVHVCERAKKSGAAAVHVATDDDSEVVVNVQGDEPLISPRLISQVARILVKNRAASVSTACHAIHDEASLASPNVVKVVLDREGYALYFSRSRIPFPREGDSKCYRHAGIYGYRVAFLKKYARLRPSPLEKSEALEQLRALWHGYRIAVTVSETEIPPGVDTPQDLEAVRRMLS